MSSFVTTQFLFCTTWKRNGGKYAKAVKTQKTLQCRHEKKSISYATRSTIKVSRKVFLKLIFFFLNKGALCALRGASGSTWMMLYSFIFSPRVSQARPGQEKMISPGRSINQSWQDALTVMKISLGSCDTGWRWSIYAAIYILCL